MTESKELLVLIVDDDPLVIGQVGEVLQSAGFEYVQAHNGVEGLRHLNEAKPGLVILDVNMPELDGMQTCRFIRANEKFRTLPILILTSKSDIRHMLEARKMGADDYLVKPVDRESLLTKVEKLLSR